MQLESELGIQASHAEIGLPSTSRRKALARRKVTVRLTEDLYKRFSVATERPGIGKSMLVEAALDGFLKPAPSLEDIASERFGDMQARFDRLERQMRVMAEIVSLHARYHLAVMPPLDPSRQRDAALLGDERFKLLAEQVDRRVRLDRPLMQETIDRLGTAAGEDLEPALDDGDEPPGLKDNEARSDDTDFERPPAVPGSGGGSNSSFRRSSVGSVEEGKPHPRSTPQNNNQKLRREAETSKEQAPSKWRLVLSVFFPFAAGYYLSFLFRTINASISPALASDFGLGAVETGLLASIYFLVFAGAQIPIGVLLDRYGPRRVQSVLLVFAVGGASLFGNADSFAELLIGRAMIGLGVAASLMAGLKAVVVWFPKDRIAFVNGAMIMLGSLGAVTATAPTDWLLHLIGWRSLFELLTIATVVTAGLIYFTVPKRDGAHRGEATSDKSLTLRSIFSDSRFLRIAPLSAICIGSSWAMQSLWAASWLADVEQLDHQAVVNQLFVMALGISFGALLLGTLADRLRKRGIATEVLLAVFGVLFMLAELALILRVPLPSVLPWSVVSVLGAGTVLSYAIVADYFPVEIAARANGALNLLHFGCAFMVQYGIGLIVGHWSAQDGHYPVVAYQTAFGLSIVIQAVALMWFAVPWLRDLSGRVSSAIAYTGAGSASQLDVALAPAEVSILETSPGLDW